MCVFTCAEFERNIVANWFLFGFGASEHAKRKSEENIFYFIYVYESTKFDINTKPLPSFDSQER